MAAKKTSKGSDGTGGRIVLSSKLDFRASETLAEELRAHRGSDIVIDCQEVEQLGAHALQTLVVASASWRKDGHAFAVENLSGNTVEQMTTMGFQQTIFAGEGEV